MSFVAEHKRKFDNLTAALDVQNRSLLRAQANGGNTILFSYPSEEESLYIEQARQQFPQAAFIDLSQLLVQYIDKIGWDDFRAFYQAYETSSYQVFKSNDERVDFFDSIILTIQQAFEAQKTPFLIRTGVLLGTGIENVNIMEHNVVMECNLPLVIFYPSRLENDNLFFLNFKPASKYRCTLIH